MLFSSESKRKVERVSKLSFRRSRSTRAGSEESHSCSSSSQEDEENVQQETITIFRKLELVPHLDFQASKSSEISNIDNTGVIISDDRSDHTPVRSLIDKEVEVKVRNVFKTSANSEELQRKSLNNDVNNSYCIEHSSTATRILPSVSVIADELVVDGIPHEMSKPVKAIKRNDRKCKTSFHTNQSFNILAHRNQSTAKTTSNMTNSPLHSKVKLRENKLTCLVITAEIPNKCLPRMAPTCKITKDEVTSTKRGAETCQHTRLSGDDKKANRDLRSAGPSKKPVLGPTLRARSAVDHVTYNDMFLKISRDDEGPTIYEMFATPAYENLKVDNSAEKTRQSHTALKVKRQTSGKQRGPKTTEVTRRKQTDKYSRAKCRQHKRRDNIPKRIKKHPSPIENKCHNVSSHCEAEEEQRNSKMPFLEDDVSDVPSWVIKRQNSPILSVIEEVLSNTLSKPNIAQNNSSVTRFETHLIHSTTHQKPQMPTDSGEPQISSTTTLPAQPLMNTWTSDRTVSPVYQKFLEEVGDGPLTDDLLRSLAEGLISLEEKETETLETEKNDGKDFGNNLSLKFKKLLNEVNC